ncbi:heparan-alpha-glucosaminide N-acetyltransferase domain-containing protein [Cellulosimicrobium sp. NPDC055967]|uniref:heparan-alpha-glucosaminide N-acetyltransferase domain-containing protein n=1 Tax=Cellulosimicrobium sp. NPDC055967 TaxID=3345670 RepID=UPI0035DA003D
MTAATGMTPAPGDPARSSPGFARRHAALLLGGPGRVTGVDVARGIAVLGMFAAHVGYTSDDFGEASGWLSLSHGRSSILFALVAGVSLAIVSGGRTPLDGLPALQTRTRILVRAVLLLGLVGLLDLLGTRVLLILGFYAAYFVLALPFLRWRRRDLLVLAGAVAVVGPLLAYWLPEVLARAGLHLSDDGSGAFTDFLVSGHYPAVVWMAYVLVGIAIGRSDLSSTATRVGLVGGGLLAAGIGYGLSASMTGPLGGAQAVEDAAAAWSSTFRPEPLDWSDPWPTSAYLWLAGPHTDTLPEVVGSGGFAVAVLGLCLFAGRVGRWVLAPVAAVGAMALTVYSAQIVVLWAWGDAAYEQTTNGPLLALALATLAAATLWRWALGRGPLERLFAAVATRASAVTAARGSS